MIGVDVDAGRAGRGAAGERSGVPARLRRPARWSRSSRRATDAARAAAPARPAVHDRAGDPQAGAPAPDGRSAGPRPTSAPEDFIAPDLPRRLGGDRGGRRPGRPAPATHLVGPVCATRATDPAVASAVTELSVEPLPTEGAHRRLRRSSTSSGLLELTALRRIDQVKSKLQRTNPVENAETYQPDVRRAGRARGAPPQAARPDRRTQRVMSSGVPPRPVEVAAGEKVLAWAAAESGASPAPGRRSTSPAAAGSRGSRSRPPTGTSTPRRSRSARSAPGASRGRRTPSC